MRDQYRRHLTRLRRLVAAGLVGVGATAAAVTLMEAPPRLRLVQGHAIAWVFVGVAVINLVTVMPAYRAMLAGPKRVFALDRDVDALLRAHSAAHVVACVRVLSLAAFGALLFLVTGQRTWFWLFATVGSLGCALLWPLEAKLRSLVERPS